nr:MAG TPA: hypothetical protein [Caudoviricetes sp.]
MLENLLNSFNPPAFSPPPRSGYPSYYPARLWE